MATFSDRAPGSPPRVPVLCIVGVGPRATSVIERLATLANELGPGTPWELHLVDDAPFGAGRIWRTDQSPELCMNTLAGNVTLFTDERSTVNAAIVVGPTLFEWCLLAREVLEPGSADPAAAAIPGPHRAAFGRVPLPIAFAAHPHLVSELAGIRPESHPSRALFGAYITWCFDRAIALLPAEVLVVRHPTRATAVVAGRAVPIDGRNPLERVILADGSHIDADSVVLSLGWLANRSSAAERALEASIAGTGLLWVREGSPLEQPLKSIPAGAPTIVRGLGMGFFDAMALLTIGRGGVFEGAGDDLVYRASGAEPVLHVTSHRGLPYRAKSRYGQLPRPAAASHFRAFSPETLNRPVDFEIDLWPLIVQDAHAGWYRRLFELRPSAFTTPTTAGLAAVLGVIADRASVLDPATLDSAIAPLVPGVSDRFDFAAATNPVSGDFTSPDDYQRAVLGYVRADLHESALGHNSPLKAALWEINAARRPVSKLLAFDGGSAETHASAAHRRFVSLGGMIGSGPPAFRNAQLLALADAGLVRFIGPAASVTVAKDAERAGRDGGAFFVASSPTVAGSAVRAPALLDAFLSSHDSGVSDDPVIRSLVERRVLRQHSRPTRTGGRGPGPGIDIEPGTSRLIHVDGSVDGRVHLIGIPVSDNRGDTVISPIPGSDATFLRESDGVALASFAALFPHRVDLRTIAHV
ncbi:MAG: FAD/NAD(P)-binding protein [Glaciihabitans sp.]|nr:FAD/NAD(P)-binding protein [Glaciihabitans sp.]